jgi:hypothetical protein
MQTPALIQMKITSALSRIFASLLKRHFWEHKKSGSKPSPDRSNNPRRVIPTCAAFSVRSPADQLHLVAVRLDDFQSPGPGGIDQ